MPQHRRGYTARRYRSTSRKVNSSLVGTHVERRGDAVQSRRRHYNQALVRRARVKRVLIGLVAVIAVVAVAVVVGLLAFRGVVGSELSLKDSDAKSALVPGRLDEPSYLLVSAELGAVATPLDNEGPDVILLARLDPQNRSLALVNIPSALQITRDNQSSSIASIAHRSDADMILAVAQLAKIDIAHYVKIQDEDDFAGLVDALGGIKVDVKQEIDDPRAGNLSIAAGEQNLNGEAALTYLRATNIEFGVEDQLVNQLNFATQMVARVFSSEGNFATRIDSTDAFFQTDLSLGDMETINKWLGGVEASSISTTVLPGYFTANTNVSSDDGSRYISTASDVAEMIEKLGNNEKLSADAMGSMDAVSPSSFTVSIQNGTSIEGAAGAAADLLKKEGFKVGDVGNAENPVYEETIVVYKSDDDQGKPRAKTLIDALGVGRAVNGSAYYSFDSDILLIIGADNKPVS